MKESELEEFLDILHSHPDTPLRFYHNNNSINPGYRLTEVKHASIKSMDCGNRADAWEELLIQLLDGENESSQEFMSTSKFSRIVASTIKSLPKNSTPKLFFEFSPNHGPLLKLKMQSVEHEGDELHLRLIHEKATCKPMDRWGKAGPMFGAVCSKVRRTRCCSG